MDVPLTTTPITLGHALLNLPTRCMSCRGEVLRMVNLAQRYKLRDLMAQCMPYVVEDSFNTVDSPALEVPYDAEVMKAVVVGIIKSTRALGGSISLGSFRVGTGRDAVSTSFYLQYLAGWGH